MTPKAEDVSPVLVTGGTGFLGSALLRRLVAMGLEVHTVVRAGSDASRLDGASPVQRSEGDLRDGTFVESLVRGVRPRTVYHCAATGVLGAGTPDEVVASNTVSAFNLMRACEGCPPGLVVNTGSCAEYAPPDVLARFLEAADVFTAYAVSKCVTTDLWTGWSRRTGGRLVTLRPYCLYGPREAPQRIVSALIRAVLEDRELDLTDGRQTRDFLFIDDAVDAFVSALDARFESPAVLDLGSGREHSLRDVAAYVESTLERSGAFRWGAVPRRRFEPTLPKAGVAATRRALNWSPRTSLEQGVARTAEWHRSS